MNVKKSLTFDFKNLILKFKIFIFGNIHSNAKTNRVKRIFLNVKFAMLCVSRAKIIHTSTKFS